jgi:hypothetical protein
VARRSVPVRHLSYCNGGALGRRLTIRPSRRHFVARLNSGVRRHCSRHHCVELPASTASQSFVVCLRLHCASSVPGKARRSGILGIHATRFARGSTHGDLLARLHVLTPPALRAACSVVALRLWLRLQSRHAAGVCQHVVLGSRRLTIRPSRHRFAVRLNSGVRRCCCRFHCSVLFWLASSWWIALLFRPHHASGVPGKARHSGVLGIYATRFARGSARGERWLARVHHAARVARGLLCRGFALPASATVVPCRRGRPDMVVGSRRLTIRPSRTRFVASLKCVAAAASQAPYSFVAGRLNSGVRAPSYLLQYSESR